MTLALGYSLSSFLEYLPTAYASVRGPILPIYISAIMIILPKGVNLKVTPVDNPTAPNAETASNSKCSRVAFCVMSKIPVPKKTMNPDTTTIVIAL